MTLTAARQVADAVLYEGYLLYPYRASSAKNQVRWQFGVLSPVGALEAGLGEEPTMWCDLLVEGDLDVWVRFLQVQQRTLTDLDGTPVAELHTGDTRWIPYYEAVPQEIHLTGVSSSEPSTHALVVPGGVDLEEVDGGRLVRTRWPLVASLTVVPAPRGVRVSVTNDVQYDDSWPDRDSTACHGLVGTHLLVTGAVRSTLGETVEQHRCWPALIHDDQGHDAVLVAPIILGDHPAIAPESAGDLFDATEIDEILTLRVLTLTDEERAAARGTDPRAAAILDRCSAMTDEELGQLHGARREEDVDPTRDSTLVAGVPISRGARVLLRPNRRADVQDMFLAGMVGVVARVYTDFDGRTHVAVTLEDDPAADLYDTTGRFYYFAPDELEPLAVRQGST